MSKAATATATATGDVVLTLPGDYAVIKLGSPDRTAVDRAAASSGGGGGGRSVLGGLARLFSGSGGGDGAASSASGLGDAWSSDTGPAAFAGSELRSVDPPDLGDAPNGTSSGLRVAFRNETPVPLTLCWVNRGGEPFHFYVLEPQCPDSVCGGGGEEEEEGDPVVRDGDHIEITTVGHAFVLALRSVERPDDRVKGEGEDGDEDEKENGVGDGGGAPYLPPERAPALSRALGCWSDCGAPGSASSSSSAPASSPPAKDWRVRPCPSSDRALDPADVVGGYRPMRVTSEEGEGATEHPRRVHVIRIARRRARRRRGGGGGLALWGVPGDDGGSAGRGWRWVYTVTVEEGELEKTPLDTSDKVYRCMTLGGWPVRCEEGLWEDGDVGDDHGKEVGGREEKERKAKELIAADLEAAARHLPPRVREALREGTPIWINRSQKYGPKCSPVNGKGMCFHSDEHWLVENGMSAAKAGGVEMYRASAYPDDRDLWGPGGVMLHELSHAYHKKHVPDGFKNADVIKCYESALKKGLYDCVRVHGPQGPECRAYACQNPMEYFAELSVAFLGGLDANKEHNKWFPFNREQLRKHDPDAYETLKKVWGVDGETE